MKNLLLVQFELHQRLFSNALAGFSDEETNQRLNGNVQINHIKYIAGHLLNSQYGLAIMAGINLETKWNELFAVMGQSQAKDNFPYPAIEEIIAEWNKLYNPLKDALEKLTPEMLNASPPKPFDQVATSSGELWAFINHHIAYHIGQIGILRRGFGKTPMSYE